MFQHQTRILLLAVLAASLLALSGCGGSGSTTAPAPVDPTPPAPVPVAVDLSSVADDAMVEAGTADIAAGASADIGEITFTCAAGGEACSVTVDAAGMATATGGTVTAATSSGYATRKANEAAAVAATTKAAGTKATAITAEAAQSAANDGGLGGSQADGTPVTTYSMTVSRNSDGTTIKITDSALAGDDDPKFTQAMDLGGGSTMHTRTMKADDDGNVVEEVVIVSTDIEAPTPVAFAKFKDAFGGTPQTLNDRTDTVDPNDDNVADSLSVPGTPGTVALNPADANDGTSVYTLVKAASFTAAGELTLTFDADVASTADKNEAAVVMGSFNGAMGTYTCTTPDTNCTVTRAVSDEKFTISAMSAGWVFTPAADAQSPQSDYDYVDYGFWLKKTTDAMGVVTYNEVETFARASRAQTADASAVRGSATYKGGATGVYVKNVFNTDGTINMATSGHFTADATLMATFGQVHEGDDPADTSQDGTIAPNVLNTVTGTIDKFVLSGGEGNAWSVALEGDITATPASATGTAKGGVKGQDGSFTATFHGSVAAAADGSIPHPSAAVGEFNSVFSDGSVAGAFGTQLQTEE